MRYRSHVVSARIMHRVHRLRTKGAGGCAIALSAGRDRPRRIMGPVDIHVHALLRQADPYLHGGVRLIEICSAKDKQEREDTEPPPHRHASSSRRFGKRCVPDAISIDDPAWREEATSTGLLACERQPGIAARSTDGQLGMVPAEGFEPPTTRLRMGSEPVPERPRQPHSLSLSPGSCCFIEAFAAI